MSRTARFVLPGYPHHVTQRGNRRQRTFFHDADYGLYFELIAEACRSHDVVCWAYCFMPNHVHLVLVPQTETGLAGALKQAHQGYASIINRRQNWSGSLWQGRFHSCAMDEAHLRQAIRYVERNPVRAGLVREPRDWRWSSARAHLAGRGDALLTRSPLSAEIGDWRSYLARGLEPAMEAKFGVHTRNGFPMGSDAWVDGLESAHARPLRPGRPGPKRGA